MLLLSVTALAADDWQYSIADGTAKITKYTGSAETVEIPKELGGAAVTVIGDGAFRFNTKIREITMPDSITKIETRAFDYCSSLSKSVSISESSRA